ncbi:hypothetical protein Tco_1133463 [Tanacetum coccineum]
MAFGGNTRNLGSFGEETDDITDLHQILEEVFLTERGDGVTSIKRRRRDLFSDGVWNLETVSGCGRLKEDLESSTETNPSPYSSFIGLNFVGETLRKSDQLHQTFEKSSIAMTLMVKMPKCMAWLNDEPIGDLDTMEDKVDNPSPQCTLQVLPSFENANPPPTSNRPILPAALRAQAVQELHELQRISDFVDSRLESIEQFHNNFANHPNETNMNDLESDDKSVDTPLVSPFPRSDNDSYDGEVLNELIEYENVGMLRRKNEINSFDGDDLAF